MKPILRAVVSGVIGFLSAMLAAVSAMPGDPTLAQVPLSVWLLAALAGLTSLYSPNGVTLTKAPQLRRAEDPAEPERTPPNN